MNLHECFLPIRVFLLLCPIEVEALTVCVINILAKNCTLSKMTDPAQFIFQILQTATIEKGFINKI